MRVPFNASRPKEKSPNRVTTASAFGGRCALREVLPVKERLRILRGRLVSLKEGKGSYSPNNRSLAIRQCENALCRIERERV